jgi:outer membrane protein OmpA-like peptidoglycan-associated protein
MKLSSILMPISLGVTACASSTPTPELVQARDAYLRATHTPETRLAPASLLNAKQALDRAEAVHEDSPQSEEERTYAYIAQRKAELAVLDGTMQKDRNERVAAEQRYDQLQDAQRVNAQSQLGTMSAQLNSQRQLTNATAVELERERARTQRALQSLEKIGQLKEEARGTVLTLSGQVLFVTGKSELLPTARDQLGQVAKALSEPGQTQTITIEGHTDSRGDEAMNMKLSQERADAVKMYLISVGVPAERITAVGKGEGTPVASNDTPEGRANNRRVEIVMSNDQRPQSSVVGAR